MRKSMNKSAIRLLFLFGILILAPLSQAVAEEGIKQFAVGEKLEPYALEDQHGNPWSLQPTTKRVILSFEMDLSKGVHQWLEKKDSNFLDQHQTEYVADITPMPDIITYLFAGPKMRRYPFRIVLADKEFFADVFPKEEGKLTVLELAEDRKITNVGFFSSMSEIDQAYFSAKESTNKDNVEAASQGASTEIVEVN